MGLRERVEAALREASLFSSAADDPPVLIEDSTDGTVIIRRHPGGTAGLGFLVGDILGRVDRALSDQGFHVTEERGDDHAPPYLGVWPGS